MLFIHRKKIHVKVCFTVQLKDLRFLFRFFLNTKFSKQLQHNVLFCYLYCFFFFRRASRKFLFLLFSLLLLLACGFSLVRFLTNSFLRVSLSAFGFLCSLSISLNVSSSPLGKK
uniref:Transmembrane protein n=1 Tax=Maylandia zebra TaxID=106582 RepID=A0A3P9CZQ9_9CICH